MLSLNYIYHALVKALAFTICLIPPCKYTKFIPESGEQGAHDDNLESNIAPSIRPLGTECITISSTITGNPLKLSCVYLTEPSISYMLTLLIPLQDGHFPVEDTRSQTDGTLGCERLHVYIIELLCG